MGEDLFDSWKFSEEVDGLSFWVEPQQPPHLVASIEKDDESLLLTS